MSNPAADILKKTSALINAHTGKVAATRLVEVAPGQWTAPAIDPADVPRFGIVRLMRQQDGSYLPILKHYSQYIKITEGLPEALGYIGLSYTTLYRLCHAGFIKSSKPSPLVILIDILSLADHVEAARDPEFWTPERRRIWSDACAACQTNRAMRKPTD